jgi:hypothetical protein
MPYRKFRHEIPIPHHLEVLKVCPQSDGFILEMEPALRQLIRVRGAAPADQIYMDFIQYQIAPNPSSGQSRWRDYDFLKFTFGIWFMCRLDFHIDLVLRGAAPRHGHPIPRRTASFIQTF